MATTAAVLLRRGVLSPRSLARTRLSVGHLFAFYSPCSTATSQWARLFSEPLQQRFVASGSRVVGEDVSSRWSSTFVPKLKLKKLPRPTKPVNAIAAKRGNWANAKSQVEEPTVTRRPRGSLSKKQRQFESRTAVDTKGSKTKQLSIKGGRLSKPNADKKLSKSTSETKNTKPPRNTQPNNKRSEPKQKSSAARTDFDKKSTRAPSTERPTPKLPQPRTRVGDVVRPSVSDYSSQPSPVPTVTLPPPTPPPPTTTGATPTATAAVPPRTPPATHPTPTPPTTPPTATATTPPPTATATPPTTPPPPRTEGSLHATEDTRAKRIWRGQTVQSVKPSSNPTYIRQRLKKNLPVGFNEDSLYPEIMRTYLILKNKLGRRNLISSFDEHKRYKAKLHDTFKGMLLPLEIDTSNDNPVARLALLDVPLPTVPSAWLPIANYIPVREYMGLVNAARWFKTGVQYRQLDHKIFPLPGCYFATPTSNWIVFHFEVFADWLNAGGLEGVENAVDVGTGCGVISYMLLKHGSPTLNITAVDINPAAVNTTNQTALAIGAKNSDGTLRLIAHEGDLFPENNACEKQDLIVFNPPWLPVEDVDKKALEDGSENQIFLASYREETLMQRFFEQSHQRLNDNGRVCVIYSNYAQIIGVEDSPNAIERELAEQTRFTLISKEERKLPLSSKMKQNKEAEWRTNIVKQLNCQIYVLQKNESHIPHPVTTPTTH